MITLWRKFVCLLIFLPVLAYSQSEECSYSELLEKAIAARDSLSDVYRQSGEEGKGAIIQYSRDFLIETLTTKVFPFWYGTKWDFNGQSRIPKEGTIACGYFVTNTLSDVGFNIPRIKWAQSPSEYFIQILASDHVERFANRPIYEVADYLKENGPGIYIVGLDDHVGYIVVNGQSMKFVHSSYYRPEIGVLSEKIYSWNPLRYSKYRIVGRLFSDDMIIHWLENEPY